MRKVLICSAAALGALMATAASAQSNPFLPPQGGMSRAQIQEIVRQEVDRAKASASKTEASAIPGAPGSPPAGTGAAVGKLGTQPGGTPNANVASTAPQGPATPASDAVADLVKDGGIFVGCVGGTPVFKDKSGRRAYFTSKELRESNEARRFTRCG